MKDADKALETYYLKYSDLDRDGIDVEFKPEQADIDDYEAQARADAADARAAKK